MRDRIVDLLSKGLSVPREKIDSILEVPKDPNLGDFALPCFIFAKELRKNPLEVAKEFSIKIKSSEVEKVQAVGPYVNIFLNKSQLANDVVSNILRQKEKYGSSKMGNGKKVVIEFSSPNIAKPFGIGHLRSSIIGNSISNISSFIGYKATKINYLGDWGTQFGKLILGYKKFGSATKLKKDSISHLLELYVKVNSDPSLEEQSRNEFKKLEQGNKENLALWKKFRTLSLKEFDEIYKLLGIKFDVISGESLYSKQMEKIVDLLEDKHLIKKDQGAEIVDLSNYNLGVCLIKKSDGTTLYATRDVATAIDRYNKYKFDLMLYEVGSEQTLHFKQFFKVLELLGYNWASRLHHVAHGLYLDQDGKKFATRKGKTVFMSDILEETISLAREELKKRDKLSKSELEKRARTIALAAIVYGDLKNYREGSVVFDIERFLSFEGDTGPYLLYTYARARSILRKSKNKGSIKPEGNLSEKEIALVSKLSLFPEIVTKSFSNYAPHTIANYAFELSQTFNEFYHSEQVIGSENESFKISLVKATTIVLKNALSLLGIPVLEKM